MWRCIHTLGKGALDLKIIVLILHVLVWVVVIMGQIWIAG